MSHLDDRGRHHEAVMRCAIESMADANPHPNPRVAAIVLDRDGREIGRGLHVSAGSPHAEVLALDAVPAGSHPHTMVVTLEPCAHHGRTPPCADAIVESGIQRVFVGTVDPDDRVSGRGVAYLRQSGIEVIVTDAPVEAADRGYYHHRRTGRPLVTLKMAMTLDGQIGAVDGTSQWITSEESRADAHRLRAQADVVMVGAGTVRNDDPALDVRLPGYSGPQPRPVIIAGSQPAPPQRRLYLRSPIVYTPSEGSWPGEVVIFEGVGGRVDLRTVLKDLEARGSLHVLVEGGSALAAAMWDGGLVDELVMYVGACVAGGSGLPVFDGTFHTMAQARPIDIVDISRFGPDVRITARSKEGPR